MLHRRVVWCRSRYRVNLGDGTGVVTRTLLGYLQCRANLMFEDLRSVMRFLFIDTKIVVDPWAECESVFRVGSTEIGRADLRCVTVVVAGEKLTAKVSPSFVLQFAN